MPGTLDVRVTVIDIKGLVKNDAPCSPYVRIRLGDLLGETVSGLPEGAKDGPVGNYTFNNSMTFAGVDEDDDLALEVVNLTDKQVLGRAVISNWFDALGEKGKRNFSVDLDVMGVMKLRVELPSRVGGGASGAPDRVEVLLGPLSGLPAWVMSPQILARIGESNFSSGPPKAHVGVGCFDFLESHTLRYNGERELELTIIDEDERPVGISRFDLYELRAARNPKWQRAGKLAITNLRGEVVGSVSLGIMLWDHAKAGETGGAAIPREQLLAALDQTKALYDYLEPEMPDHQKQQRHFEKARNCMELARKDVAAAEESEKVLADDTRRLGSTAKARQSYNDCARKANHAIFSAAANLQVVASAAGTSREAAGTLVRQRCAQELEAVQKMLLNEQRALSARSAISPRRVTTARATANSPTLASSQPVQEAVQRMAANAADVEQTCQQLKDLAEHVRLNTEDPGDLLSSLKAMDGKLAHLKELQSVIAADHHQIDDVRLQLLEERRALAQQPLPEYEAIPLNAERQGPLGCFPCCMTVPAAT